MQDPDCQRCSAGVRVFAQRGLCAVICAYPTFKTNFSLHLHNHPKGKGRSVGKTPSILQDHRGTANSRHFEKPQELSTSPERAPSGAARHRPLWWGGEDPQVQIPVCKINPTAPSRSFFPAWWGEPTGERFGISFRGLFQRCHTAAGLRLLLDREESGKKSSQKWPASPARASC